MKTNKKLFEAAEKGYLDKVKKIINPKLFGLIKGANIESKNEEGWTPLICAAIYCQSETAHFLIEKNANINAATSKGFTPLMAASKFGAYDIVSSLIKNRASLDKATDEGWTALMYGSWQGQLKIVQLLAEAGADIHAKSKEDWPAIMWAAQEGRSDVVNYLISIGADPNTCDQEKWNVLHEATCKGHLDTVSTLIDNGANVNNANINNFTPLMAAAKFGFPEIANLLISNGAEVNIKKINEDPGWTALIFATWKAQTSVSKILIENNANAKDLTGDKWNALMFASREGDLETVKLLLEKGADVDVQSDEGYTALLLASNNDRKQIVELLLKNNANVFLKDKDGKTACDFAQNKGFKDIVKRLIKAEAESSCHWIPYYSDEWNISISYPPSWKILWENEQAGSWMIPIAVAGNEGTEGQPCFMVNARRGEILQGNENLKVYNGGMEVPSTPEEHIEVTKRNLATEFPDFRFSSGEKITLANRPASRMLYSYKGQKGRMHEEMVTWFGVGLSIQFICEVPNIDASLYAPFFKQMLDSFRIGNPSVSVAPEIDIENLSPIQQYNAATLLYRNGEFKKSLAIFEKCIEHNETHLQALYAKALCQQELGLNTSFDNESEEDVEKAGPVYVAGNVACKLIESGFQVTLPQMGKTSKIITKIGSEQHLIHVSSGFGFGGFFNMAWRMEGNKTIPVNDPSVNPNPTKADKQVIEVLQLATSLPPYSLPEAGFKKDFE